jgi:hypothetical protein
MLFLLNVRAKAPEIGVSKGRTGQAVRTPIIGASAPCGHLRRWWLALARWRSARRPLARAQLPGPHHAIARFAAAPRPFAASRRRFRENQSFSGTAIKEPICAAWTRPGNSYVLSRALSCARFPSPFLAIVPPGRCTLIATFIQNGLSRIAAFAHCSIIFPICRVAGCQSRAPPSPPKQ